MNFLTKQTELHRKAANTLQSIEIKSESIANMDPSFTHLKFLQQRELDRLYLVYHDTIKEIMEGIIPDMNIQGVIVQKENCVTLAESFFY